MQTSPERVLRCFLCIYIFLTSNVEFSVLGVRDYGFFFFFPSSLEQLTRNMERCAQALRSIFCLLQSTSIQTLDCCLSSCLRSPPVSSNTAQTCIFAYFLLRLRRKQCRSGSVCISSDPVPCPNTPQAIKEKQKSN